MSVCNPTRKQSMALAQEVTNEQKKGKCGLCLNFHLELFTEDYGNPDNRKTIHHERGYCVLNPEWKMIAGVKKDREDYHDDFMARWDHFCGQFVLSTNPCLYKHEKETTVVQEAEKIIEKQEK